MKLPYPHSTKGLSRWDEIERNRQIELADALNHKKNADVEIGDHRLIITDDTTGTRYELYIDNGSLLTRTV